MKTQIPNEIRRIFIKGLGKRWSWQLIFIHSSMFADLTIDGPRTFASKKGARMDMEEFIQRLTFHTV